MFGHPALRLLFLLKLRGGLRMQVRKLRRPSSWIFLIVGGLLVGVIDNLAAASVTAAYRQALPLALLVLIILFRPQGLLGRREERTV